MSYSKSEPYALNSFTYSTFLTRYQKFRPINKNEKVISRCTTDK